MQPLPRHHHETSQPNDPLATSGQVERARTVDRRRTLVVSVCFVCGYLATGGSNHANVLFDSFEPPPGPPKLWADGGTLQFASGTTS